MSERKPPGLFRRGASLVKRETSYVLGVEHMKLGARSLSTQWHRASKRVCPACSVGRLYRFTEVIEGQKEYFLGCNNCDHYQATKAASDPESLQRLRDIALKKLQGMSAEDRRKLLRKYQLSSRWLYAFSVVVILFAVYLLFTGGSAWTFLNASAVSMFLFVQGLIASYRFWQLREKALFVLGAFKQWIGSGQWLV